MTAQKNCITIERQENIKLNMLYDADIKKGCRRCDICISNI